MPDHSPNIEPAWKTEMRQDRRDIAARDIAAIAECLAWQMRQIDNLPNVATLEEFHDWQAVHNGRTYAEYDGHMVTDDPYACA